MRGSIRRLGSAVLAIAVVAFVPPHQAVAGPVPPSITDLGTLGCNTSNASRVLSAARVIGQSCLADNTPRAFVWTKAAGMSDLGTLGGAWTEVASGGNQGDGQLAVSPSGQAVGTSRTATSIHGFSWTQAGGIVDIGVLPGDTQSAANAVSDNGQVVGYSFNGTVQHAILWTEANGLVDLGTLGGNTSVAYAVSDSGQVVGYSTLAGDAVTEPFSWTEAGGMVDLGNFGGTNSVAEAVNSNGVVVGAGTDVHGDNHAFVWTEAGGLVDLGTLGGSQSVAQAISPSGDVVGYSTIAGDTANHAFLWTTGSMTDLGVPGSYTDAVAISIDANGRVLGQATGSGNNCPCAAVSWDPQNGISDLGSLVGGATPAAVRPRTAVVSDARASTTNDIGQIAGSSVTSAGYHHAVLWPQESTAVTVTTSGATVSHQSVSLTAHVTSASGAIPDGSVTFYEGTTVLGSGSLSTGQVIVATTVLGAGVHPVTAHYDGTTAAFRPSASNSIGQTVTKASTTTTVSTLTNPSATGQVVSYSNQTTAVSPGGGSPTGLVTFRDGSSSIAGCSGIAIGTPCAVTFTTPGTHSITSTYTGNADYLASASTVWTQTVNSAPFHAATMDAFGGIHPFATPSVTTTHAPYWPGWSIARGIAVLPNGSGGYTLDGWGGVHAWGSATTNSAAMWPGFDIARSIVLNNCDATGKSGYVLDGFGGVHQFGGAPTVVLNAGSYTLGSDIAKSMSLNPCSAGKVSGYVLNAYGAAHGFSSGVAIANATGTVWPGWNIARGIAVTGTGRGYILDGLGGIHPFGGAPVLASPAYFGRDIARAIVARPDGTGGYTLDGYGGVHAFGTAPVVPGPPGAYWPGWDIARAIGGAG